MSSIINCHILQTHCGQPCQLEQLKRQPISEIHTSLYVSISDPASSLPHLFLNVSSSRLRMFISVIAFRLCSSASVWKERQRPNPDYMNGADSKDFNPVLRQFHRIWKTALQTTLPIKRTPLVFYSTAQSIVFDLIGQWVQKNWLFEL